MNTLDPLEDPHVGFVKVYFVIDNPSVKTESMWAEPLSTGHYALRNAPFYADACYGDVVQASEDEYGALRVDHVVEQTGINLTVTARTDKKDVMPTVLTPISYMGCAVEHMAGRFWAVSVPARVDIDAVIAKLNEHSDVLEHDG